MKFDTSEKMFQEAIKVMPGGVNSPVRAFGSVGRTPLFIDHARGSKIVDVDGNEFIDYVCSYGPGILGHARPEVVEAVQKAAVDGLTYGAPTKKETIIAQMIRDCMPSMEVCRLVSSGTEAVMSAIRTARGYTGRDKIIKFKGCYHGHSDGLLVKAGSAALTSSVPDSAGVPKGYTQTTLVALYNDEESVRRLFAENKGEIAALIVEPVAANMGVVPPKEGFLQFLRDITYDNGTVLIFDEVITGFRLSLGGAQQYYGIEADMTTIGKIVGGGMPMAAYGGRKEIMDHVSPVGKVYQAGTLSGNPIATAAGIKTLEILQNDTAIYDRIDQSATKIAEAMRRRSKESGIPMQVNQVGSLLCAYFTDQPVIDYAGATSSDMEAFTEHFGYALEHGVYIAPSQYEAMFVSDAHDETDIKKTCDVILRRTGA